MTPSERRQEAGTDPDVPTRRRWSRRIAAPVVELSADGDARVTLVETFDLTTDHERRAFESIRAG